MWILILVLLILAALYIYGLRHAQDIRISPYHIHVEKGSKLKNLKIALIADLHLGRNMGCEMARQMVDKINALEPDVILIAGDIFDNCFDHLDDPQKLSAIFRELKSSYGVYAVYGNHDIDETLFCGFTTDFKSEKVSDPRMDAFLIDSHIELLRDEGRLVHSRIQTAQAYLQDESGLED